MIEGVFDEFFGVPTHPLAVHAPVVLIPFATVAAIVFVVRADWRARTSTAMAGLVFVMVAALFVAKESGEAAKEADNVFGDIDAHEDLANTTFIMGVVWFVLTAGVAVREWMQRRSATQTQSLSARQATIGRDQIAFALSVLAAVAAVLTTIWLIRTGHAGAESRWKV
jgi:hypothetical protein